MSAVWVPEHITEEYLQLLEALAADLRAADYRVEAIGELLGELATDALDREQAVPARRRIRQIMAAAEDQGEPLTARPQRLATIISVWMLGDRVPVDRIEAALPTLTAQGAEQLRLGTRDTSEGTFRAVVDLSAYSSDDLGDMWVASDQTALQLRTPIPDDHVLGIGQASLTLASLVPRHKVARALDIGVGCGIQTFHLLAHAEHVTATDISPDALAFTRFNLLLNADQLSLNPRQLDDRVTLREGSLLEPVAGHTFDLVVSNPPFVITPPTTTSHTYRSTDAGGDAVTEQLVTTVGEVLAPGGQLVMMANWEIPSGAQWDTRIRSWAEQIPELDVWVIQRDEQDIAGYAETWLQDSSENLDPDRYAIGYQNYLDYFESAGVDSVGFGWVQITKQPAGSRGERLVRCERYADAVIQPVASAWHDAYRLFRALHPGDGVMVTEILSDTYLHVPHHVTEEQHQHFGAEHPEVLIARSGAGFCRSAVLDTATAAVLSVSDGELTTGQIVAAVSGLLDLDDTAIHQLWQAIAALVVDGFVLVKNKDTTSL